MLASVKPLTSSVKEGGVGGGRRESGVRERSRGVMGEEGLNIFKKIESIQLITLYPVRQLMAPARQHARTHTVCVCVCVCVCVSAHMKEW